jgi:hypothetical protein
MGGRDYAGSARRHVAPIRRSRCRAGRTRGSGHPTGSRQVGFPLDSGDPVFGANSGLTLGVSDDLVVDGGARLGLSDAAEDVAFFLGGSVRYRAARASQRPDTPANGAVFPAAIFISKRWRERRSGARLSRHMSLPRRSRLLLALWPATLAALVTFAPAASAANDTAVPVLAEGATYRARLRLGFFQCLAPRDSIGKKLSGSGFANVRVFMSRRELPADWPSAFRSKAGSCERYAEGVWKRPTTPRRKPSSIDAWWMASPASVP